MIPQFLAMADVVVSPREGSGNLPLKIFDYVAAGRPIVATDSPAHRMALDDERAMLVEPSAEALAEAITGLLQHPERAQRLSAAAKAYADQNLGWKVFVDFVSHLYDHTQGRARRLRKPGYAARPRAPSPPAETRTGTDPNVDE